MLLTIFTLDVPASQQPSKLWRKLYCIIVESHLVKLLRISVDSCYAIFYDVLGMTYKRNYFWPKESSHEYRSKAVEWNRGIRFDIKIKAKTENKSSFKCEGLLTFFYHNGVRHQEFLPESSTVNITLKLCTVCVKQYDIIACS